MRKNLVLCLLCSLPALAGGIDSAGSDAAPSVNSARVTSARFSPAQLTSELVAAGSGCRQVAAQGVDPPELRAVAYTPVAARRAGDGEANDVAMYVRLHRLARTDARFEWRPLPDCVAQ